MSYNFAATPLPDARAWFDMLIARLNRQFGRQYYYPLNSLPQSDHNAIACGMQDFLINDVAPRTGNADPQKHAVIVPTLDEIARTLLALDKKDKQRIYQLLYNDGCRINR